MDEKVKATWDDPQGAPVKKSAEAPQSPSRRMTARAPEIRQTPAPSFGRSAQTCRISIVSVSGPPRHRFFQGRGSLNPRRSTVFKPGRSTLHCWGSHSFKAHTGHGNRILARSLMMPRSEAVCSCSHAPSRPRHSGSFVDQRRTSLHTTKEIFNIRSPCHTGYHVASDEDWLTI